MFIDQELWKKTNDISSLISALILEFQRHLEPDISTDLGISESFSVNMIVGRMYQKRLSFDNSHYIRQLCIRGNVSAPLLNC
jgi:hypothetical protein